jgi:hypothetical protein
VNRASSRGGLCLAIAAALIVGLASARVEAQTGEMQHDEPMTGLRPEVVAHAFGSVEFLASHPVETPSSFALGQFSLFVTSAFNEHFSVLAELVLEASAADTRVTTDLERLTLTYRLNDRLRLSAGRYHTGIGYYNAAFHHGSYFETPIGRPRIFRFEDEGGVLPIHEVGLSARGTVPKTGSMLHYVAEVGNGRRWVDFEDGNELDQNQAKSTNVGLSLHPERWHGLELGGSFYRDDIPTAPDHAVAHRIAAAFGVYRTPSTEVMAEWLQLSYRQETGVRNESRGGYFQASHAFGKLRPYYRYDRLEIPPDTPFIGTFGSSEFHVLGVRFDPADWVGLKTQYERRHENGGRFNVAHVQLVFVF